VPLAKTPTPATPETLSRPTVATEPISPDRDLPSGLESFLEPDPPLAPVESVEVQRAALLAKLRELDPSPAEAQQDPSRSDSESVEEAAKRLAHEAALDLGRADPVPLLDLATGQDTILIHFLEDGFTALGEMWLRGQELEFVLPSEAYEATKDRNGKSWVDLARDEMLQARKYGKVMFRLGPWPGQPWPQDESGQKERQRNRKAPVPPRIIRRQ
jgi:hypothetical protein